MLHRPRRAVVAAVLPSLLCAAAAAAQGPVAEDAGGSPSRSVGEARRGRLLDGVPLVDTPFLRVRSPAQAYGTAELVGLLTRAAARLAARAPGPALQVGDLSRPRGGPFPPHRSHQSGRDADVGYLVTDLDGEPVAPDRWVRLADSTCGGWGRRRVCLDRFRTFAFLVALVTDPEARVQWVLMGNAMRARALSAGLRTDVSDEVMDRVRRVTRYQRDSARHHDHMHVRIYCPADDRPACRDAGTRQPWYE